MPSQPAWFERLDEIFTLLWGFDTGYLDRLAVGRLFGVRQRRACVVEYHDCSRHANRYDPGQRNLDRGFGDTCLKRFLSKLPEPIGELYFFLRSLDWPAVGCRHPHHRQVRSEVASPPRSGRFSPCAPPFRLFLHHDR